MNLVTGVLGAGCIRLGVVLSTSAAPASTFFAVLGGFVVFASVAGSVGLFLRLRFVLMAHTLLLFLLSILMTAAAVMALTSGTQGILNLSSSGALTDTLRQVVLLCQAQESGGAVPSPPPSNSTSPDAAAANVTAVGAASILNCAVDPAAAQAWVQQHLIVLGAFGVLSLVMLLFNLLACCYMLAITRPDPETDSSEDEKRRCVSLSCARALLSTNCMCVYFFTPRDSRQAAEKAAQAPAAEAGFVRRFVRQRDGGLAPSEIQEAGSCCPGGNNGARSMTTLVMRYFAKAVFNSLVHHYFPRKLKSASRRFDVVMPPTVRAAPSIDFVYTVWK